MKRGTGLRSGKALKGCFIVLEGLDGAGTTTQCSAIARALRENGREVVTTREPSDGPIGTLIRQALTGRLVLPNSRPLTPDTLALLFAADRVDHLAAEVQPALERGAIVLSDRYLLSSLAYQGSQLPLAWVAEVNARAITPHLTLFLEIDPATAAKRRAARGGREELYEAEAAQRRIAKNYHAAIAVRRKAGEALVSIDGGTPVASVTAACLAALQPLLSHR